MDTVRDRVDEAARLLADTSDTPRADAEFLMAHLLGVPRSRLALHFGEVVDVPAYRVFVERRLACEPVPYILGEWEFFSLAMKTRTPVLVPRPETEHLVEVIVEWAREHARTHTDDRGRARPTADGRAPKVLDLCTGSGCVAIAIAKDLPGATIVATDISDDAIALAVENIAFHHLKSRIQIRRGDLFDALAPKDGPFDAICANPPYVEAGAFPGLSPSIRLYEDPRALVAGNDGLDVVRRIVAESPDRLVPGGLLAIEIGEAQYGAVSKLMERAGYRNIGVRNDLAGIQRIAYARRPS